LRRSTCPQGDFPSPLTVDLVNWISNAKVLVPVSDLLKIPSQKEKLVKAINVPNDKVVVKKQEKEKEHHEYPPVVLTSKDRTKE
jgi:hypothetical protein